MKLTALGRHAPRSHGDPDRASPTRPSRRRAACDSIYVAGAGRLEFEGARRPRRGVRQVRARARAPRRRRSATSTPSATTRTPTRFSVSDREKDAIAFISSTGEVLGSIGATPTGTTPNHAKAEGADSTTDVGVARAARPRPVRAEQDRRSGRTDRSRAARRRSSTTRSTERRRSSTGSTRAPAPRRRSATPSTCRTATSWRPTARAARCTRSIRRQKLVQSFATLSQGYSCHRPTLYGPPPGR